MYDMITVLDGVHLTLTPAGSASSKDAHERACMGNVIHGVEAHRSDVWPPLPTQTSKFTGTVGFSHHTTMWNSLAGACVVRMARTC
jgi:hypothetical protein